MKLRIISFGHKRDPLFQAAVEEYSSRLVKPWGLELVDYSSERRSNDEPAKEVIKREGEKLKGVLSGKAYWTMSVLGEALTSEQLAAELGRLSGDLTFVIGGADGLDEGIERSARKRFSLSKLTLPHRLARVMLVEQLYRAQTILRGERYHK